jgi:hypothetical protein
MGTWKADAILWAETMIDVKSDAKKDEKNHRKTTDPEKMLKNSGDPEKMLKKSSNPGKGEIQNKCFYGHTTTSLKDRRGRPRWLVSPGNWPGIPLGRTLCQACYEANYQATRKGQVATINRKVQQGADADEKTKEKLTTEDTDGRNEECTLCAEDAIEDFVQHERHFSWLGLWRLEKGSTDRRYGHCTARPPG